MESCTPSYEYKLGTCTLIGCHKVNSVLPKSSIKKIVAALPHEARFASSLGTATFAMVQVERLPSIDGVSVYVSCVHLDTCLTYCKEKGS